MSGTTGRRVRAALIGAAATAALMGSEAQAVPIGDGVPVGQIGVQLYSFNTYVGGDRVKLEGILQALQAAGYRTVEPYGENYGLTPQEFRALLDEYDLRAVSRHASVDENAWTGEIGRATIMGQEYMGSGGTPAPGVGSYANTLATAAALDRLGKRSVEAGAGKAYIHNHEGEFDAQYMHDGVMTSAWEILMQETDPRYVAAEIDVFWAVRADADVAALLEKYPGRVEMLHVKDGVGYNQGVVGAGDIDFDPIFAAAKGKVRWYHLEIDPPRRRRLDRGGREELAPAEHRQREGGGARGGHLDGAHALRHGRRGARSARASGSR